MLILHQRKIFRKLFFSSLLILILLISVFGVVKIVQKHVNAAEQVYVTGDSNWAYYGDYGNGAANARTDQYKVRGSINAYCGNPSLTGLTTGYYNISSSFPSSYYDSIRLLIYLSSVGYSSHSSDTIMTTLFGSDKSNSTMRYVLTHIAIGAMYASDRSYLSSQGSTQVNTIINGLSSYISSNGSAYAESKNYTLYRVQGGSGYQDLIWIERTSTPTPTPGKVTVVKYSSGDTLDFSGIRFSIYSGSSCSGTAVGTQTIGSNENSVTFEDLTLGSTYSIKETRTNSNYTMNYDCKSATATSNGSGTGRVTFTNDPVEQSNPGKIIAVKESSSSSYAPSFAGIEFGLYTRSTCSGTPIDTQTITGSGYRVTFSNDIEVGDTYYVKEIATNDNYYLTDTECKSATATSNGSGSGKVTFTNNPILPGKVTAIKESSSSSYAPSFAGIKFSLYSSSSCSGTPISTKTLSGSASSAVFDENLEVGTTYYLKESIGTNTNYYETDTACKSVTATTNGTEASATATFTNNPIIPGKVKAVKESSSDNYKPSFAGIKFSLYSTSSCSGTPIATETLSGSNSSVVFDENLEVGTTYYLKESIGTNTNYYETDTACKSVTATTEGTESSATAIFTNNPIIPGKVKAVKESSSDNYKPSFAGIKFSLYSTSSCSGNPIETKTLSSSDSSAVFENGIEEGKTYYLKESIGTNTNYYETDTSCKSVTATTNGTEWSATATFINEPIGKVKISKCDAETNSNCGDSSIKAQGNGDFNGIKFTLYSDNQCAQVVSGTGITNPQTLSNGNISVTFEKLVAGQTYYVKESINNNTFYNESDSSCKAVTASISSSTDLRFNNTIKKANIKVIKHDSETGSCTTVGSNSFSGTSFQLINKSTNIVYYNRTVYPPNSVIDTKTLSSGDCDVTFENLPYGTYQIAETPSNGYNGGSAQTVTLSSPTTNEITFTNTAKKGKIIVNKIDADTNSCTPYNSNYSLDGTKFTLINKTNGLVYYDGNAIQHDSTIATQTLSNGVCQVTFDNLPYGEYEITEEPSFGYIPVTPTSQWATISGDSETITKTFENRFVGHSLGTVATDGKDGDQFVEAESAAKIVDTVSYCVTPGIDFVLEGTIMDKSTGSELLINGNPVKTSIPLNSETECGEVEMEFEFDASELGGQDVVVFEKLYYQDNLILEHSDINDENQTLSFLYLRTFATNRSTQAKILPLDEEVEIVDQVDYCLKTDIEYTLVGVVMDKGTGDKLLIDDAPVEDELTFTPEECCGQVEMSFTLHTANLAGAELVIFENLYQDDQLVLEHNNLYNIAQTVSVETPLPAPEPVPEITPDTGSFSKESSGANESIGVLLIACGAFGIGIIGFSIYKKAVRITFSSK